MTRALFPLAVLSLAALACLAPAVMATPAPMPTLTAQSVNKAALVITSEPAEPLAEACTFIAETDTNLRERASIDAPIVGVVKHGEMVAASCAGQWGLVIGRGWFCIAALTNSGGCD
jgi:uncharacterized protein YgiM (DUF1202 family)